MVHLQTYEGLFDFLKKKKDPIQFTLEEINTIREFSNIGRYSTYGVDISVDPEIMYIDKPTSISDKINRKLYKDSPFCQRIYVKIERSSLSAFCLIHKKEDGFTLNISGDKKDVRTIEEVCDNISVLITQCKLYLCFQDVFFSRRESAPYPRLGSIPEVSYWSHTNINQFLELKDFQKIFNDFSVVRNNKVSRFRLKSLIEEMLSDRWWVRGVGDRIPNLETNYKIILYRIDRMHIDMVD